MLYNPRVRTQFTFIQSLKKSKGTGNRTSVLEFKEQDVTFQSNLSEYLSSFFFHRKEKEKQPFFNHAASIGSKLSTIKSEEDESEFCFTLEHNYQYKKEETSDDDDVIMDSDHLEYDLQSVYFLAIHSLYHLLRNHYKKYIRIKEIHPCATYKEQE